MEVQHRGHRALAVVVLSLVGALPAWGQFESDKISLYRNFDLSALQANSGNDCWGWVAPSGREYALAGVSNAMVAVEITDPTNAQIVARVTHSNSLWGDIKVYRNYAYVSNESSGGIDVIDLSNLDNGQLRLVKRMTDNGVSRSHNVALDEEHGFLYLCGSNIGSGRLMAFDLADPENPAFAGQAPTSEVYVHDAHLRTYDTGPFGGRQIAFCFNGSRGLDILDVTNKAAMVRLSRFTYTGLSYCHQGWTSEDGTLLYMDDELDEQRGRVETTTTYVVDISDLANPTLAGTFTSGRGTIDHNLYTHNGLIFEANYRSGLHVFDPSEAPIDPQHVGYFDTYPEGEGFSFDGAWSVYPYFPSGTVIVSDLDRGLFILDVSELQPFSAPVPPNSFEVTRGELVSGELPDLFDSDESRVVVDARRPTELAASSVEIEVVGTVATDTPVALRFVVEAACSGDPVVQIVEMYNYDTQDWESVDERSIGATDTVTTLTVTADPARFVEPGTGEVSARVGFQDRGVSFPAWSGQYDQVSWSTRE
jgi:choice-of-anchor B domain-containing protein